MKTQYFCLIGADPAAVTIKWAGPAGQIMAWFDWFDGVNRDREERITWDGCNVANTIGVANKMDHSRYNISSNTAVRLRVE
jgi:hypothetical protein